MIQLIGFLELVVFVYLAYRTFVRIDSIVNLVIVNYIFQIFNHRFFGDIPLLSIGFDLYSSDLLALFLLVLVFYNKVALRKNWFTYFWIFLLLFVIQSLIRGIVAYGFTSNFFGDLRKYFYFTVAVLFFSYTSINNDLNEYVRKIDLLFVFVCSYIWIGVLMFSFGVRLGMFEDASRPLSADQAIILAFYCVYKWYNDIVVNKKIKFTTIFFTFSLIVNRFNTTWVSLAVALLIILLLNRMDFNYRPITTHLAAQIFIFIISAIILVTIASSTMVLQNVVNNFDKFDVSGTNTFSNRIELWRYLLEHFSIKDWLIGRPFGGGTGVYYQGSLWEYTIHNGYLELLLRTGFFGLASCLGLLYLVCKRAYKLKTILPIALCFACLTYWVGYNITFEIGMLIGFCANQLSLSYKKYS